jgi:predicted adenylyl cyclase CyaB
VISTSVAAPDDISDVPAGSRRNIELKAHDPRPARTLAACLRLDARDRGELRQRDTYFSVPHGALKLREQVPGRPHLIHYEREAAARPRESRYTIAEVDQADTLRTILGNALGIRVVVVKRRRVFIFDDVRIHLDVVEDLGSFVELEALTTPDSEPQRIYQVIARLRASLHIGDDQLVATGYAEQLLSAGPHLQQGA